MHTASNGPDALALAEELPRPPDLVVTDIRMEPMGGTELAERLFSRGLASRFLFVSGYGPAADYNQGLRPVSPQTFFTRPSGRGSHSSHWLIFLRSSAQPAARARARQKAGGDRGDVHLFALSGRRRPNVLRLVRAGRGDPQSTVFCCAEDRPCRISPGCGAGVHRTHLPSGGRRSW